MRPQAFGIFLTNKNIWNIYNAEKSKTQSKTK